jgi:hypothetical protein
MFFTLLIKIQYKYAIDRITSKYIESQNKEHDVGKYSDLPYTYSRGLIGCIHNCMEGVVIIPVEVCSMNPSGETLQE